ncbi:PIG-L family deacetylase [Lusitaniella coriacea LEGE 07157]|uniref:PIG-L family deacetylase n=1 Tax=Lusitaniella coriacea LEGE 07157 TaxID=945747 RepID=A0A8J7B0B8_9CYAN|nr:PIG-L deacetylase family protein [Lusitaniella coriacea]MBE9114780.1 PIG-L family deacetylase [Lusitaniella coriacea LEGE 07157]
MLQPIFNPTQQSNYKVLCLGAHCDDIEIGCGGTLLKLIENYNIFVHWVIFSSNPQRKQEALASANLFLQNVDRKQIIIKDFRDGFLPTQIVEIKEYFEQLKKEFSPDIIFTHYRHDLHQDHRLISDLTWNTFRNHFILEYEILKYDGDLGNPNFFTALEESHCSRKIEYILSAFETQKNKHWFEEETFRSLLRIRGVQSNALHRYAEAFYCRKAIIF